jgi:hypothetical protein
MLNERLFLTVWAIGLLLVWPPWIWWSIQSRRSAGYPIIPRLPSNALYGERAASGREHGKFGGAKNCLLVAVTSGEFIVAPQFPFNLVAPRGMLGLEHTVRGASIAVTLHRGWGGTNVRIFIPTERKEAVLDLKLRRPEAFIEALGGPSKGPSRIP